VSAEPRRWIAQRPVALSTSPTLIGEQPSPRHIDLRPFAVNDGNDVWLLPGGLTRVALPEGELVVNSSQGGGSKDTWVLAGDVRPQPYLFTQRQTLPVSARSSGARQPGPDPNAAGAQQQ
jgi:uncharacterized circularly permuted ATP-grasp superfamily protein